MQVQDNFFPFSFILVDLYGTKVEQRLSIHLRDGLIVGQYRGVRLFIAGQVFGSGQVEVAPRSTFSLIAQLRISVGQKLPGCPVFRFSKNKVV